MDSSDAATALAFGGLLAAVSMNKATAISMLLNKGGVGKATRQVARIHAAQPLTRIHTNVAPPMSYSLGGQVKPYSTFLKNPIESIKSAVIKDEPLWMNAKIGRQHTQRAADALRKGVPKGKKAPVKLSKLKDKEADELQNRWNEMQTLHRAGFFLPTQKSINVVDDIYRKNKSGYSFNRSNKRGKELYDQAVTITNRKTVKNSKDIKDVGYHDVMGGFNSDVYIDNKRMYEDVWDFALNKSDKVERRKLYKDLWRHVKSGRRSDENYHWFAKGHPATQPLSIKERTERIGEILPSLAKMEVRNLIGLVSHPATVRGVMNPQDLL